MKICGAIVETPYSNKTLPIHVWTSLQFKNVKADVVIFGHYVCNDVMMTSSWCHLHVNMSYCLPLYFPLTRTRSPFLIGSFIGAYGPISSLLNFKILKNLRNFWIVKMIRRFKNDFCEFWKNSKVKSSLSDVPFLINEQINLVRCSIVRNAKTAEEAHFSSPKYVPYRSDTFRKAKV